MVRFHPPPPFFVKNFSSASAPPFRLVVWYIQTKMTIQAKRTIHIGLIAAVTSIVLLLIYLRLDHVYSPRPLYKAIRKDPMSSVVITGTSSERIMLDKTGGSEDAADFFYQLRLFGSTPYVSYERWFKIDGDDSSKRKIRDDAAVLAEKYGWKKDESFTTQEALNSFIQLEKGSPEGELMELSIHLDSETGDSDDQTKPSRINTLRLDFSGTEGINYTN